MAANIQPPEEAEDAVADVDMDVEEEIPLQENLKIDLENLVECLK